MADTALNMADVSGPHCISGGEKNTDVADSPYIHTINRIRTNRSTPLGYADNDQLNCKQGSCVYML